jgi:type IV pilus assembly protein PilO
MNLNDLRRLDPREIGSWPVFPKLGVLFVLLIVVILAGYSLDWASQINDLAAARKKEVELKEAFTQKKSQAINLDAYRKQLLDVEQTFGEMLRQLPNKSEMEALLNDINQAVLSRGLKIALFAPALNETVSEFYAEKPITLKLRGTYHDFGAFASDVSQLSRIVTLTDVQLQAEKDGLLMFDATAKTYRYLDDTEQQAQRKKQVKEAKK